MIDKRHTNKPEKYAYLRLKGKAKRKGIPFDLIEEDIVFPEHCPVFNTPIKLHHIGDGNRNNSPSVDRIDPTKGYTKDNICIISYKANRLKNNATLEELEKILEYTRSKTPK